jgi:predicted O-methyltransferase YrrM
MENLEQKIKEVLNTPRMGHVWDGTLPIQPPSNSTQGIYDLIKNVFKPDFEMVEVGSFMGVSTMMFALFVKKIYAIDCYNLIHYGIPSHDQLFVDAERIFVERTKDFENIIKIKNFSTEACKDFEDNSLDAVYIDGEHDFESVQSDIKIWSKKIKSGGVLCGHDFSLPFLRGILESEGLLNNLSTYSDDSWSVIIQ